MTIRLSDYFKEFYRKVSYLGIENEGYDPYYDHKKLSNQNMFHFVGNLLFLIPITIAFTANKSVFTYSLLLIPFIAILFYLHSFHFKIARVISIQLQVILVFIGSVIYGPEADLVSFYFPILMKVFFLFKMSEKREIYLHTSIIIFFYLLYHFAQSYLSPYAIFSGQAKTIFLVTTPFKFINIVSIIYIAFNRNNESEIKLQGQKAYLQSIIDNVPLDIIIMDHQFRYRFVNKNAEQDPLIRQWMIGKNDFEYEQYRYGKTSMADEHTRLYKTAKATGAAQESEIEKVGEEGKQIQMQLVTPVSDGTKPDQNYYIVTRMDISRLKQSEDIIKQYSTSLEQKNDELKQFAYITSHDLRSPLRNIITLLQLLSKRTKGNLDQKSTELISTSIHAAEFLYRLVNDILLYSTSEISDREKEKLSVQQIVENVFMNLDNFIKEKNARIIVKSSLPTIYAHSTLITNLFHNLIENGLKYNECEQPEIMIHAIERERDHLFSIRDNGIGIQQEYKEQVFILFKRLHTQSKYEGTGIGLSICKKLVENYGGSIWVESEVGLGSTFFFSIPKESKL